MKRWIPTTAALVAAVVVWGLSLPPRRVILTDAWDDGTVRGILHVHSRSSDGRGSVDDIARAAAQAGIAFVVITDHGDGTRQPEPPSYRSGVLCIDGVEISTRNGHYVAVGMPPAPYPLGGEARDVVEDVRRLGGFGIAAHPDSPRDELSWSDWNTAIDAIELLNPDTGWRVHAFAGGLTAKGLLAASLFTYPVRPVESIARLLTTSPDVQHKWTRLDGNSAVVGLAGVDAHAKLALWDTDAGDNRFSIPLPSYESSFGVLSVHVVPAQPLTGDAGRDAVSLLQGMRSGRAYVSVDGWASPAAFELSATGGGHSLEYGESVVAGASLTLRGRSNAPDGFLTTVWRDDTVVADGLPGRAFELPIGAQPGVYRVEIRRSPVATEPAWIVSNPIYVRSSLETSTHPRGPELVGDGPALFDGRSPAGWSIENDPTSVASIDVAQLEAGPRIRLSYGLSGGDRAGQYAAATAEVASGAAAGFDGVTFSIRAERPMRISVQVRADEEGMPPQRWQRSIYLDSGETQHAIAFDDMRPVGETRQARPIRKALRAVIFVVDTTNNRPRASGRLWIGDLRLGSFKREAGSGRP